jgi:hypothetical protein
MSKNSIILLIHHRHEILILSTILHGVTEFFISTDVRISACNLY